MHNLDDYSDEELVERVWVLHDHNVMLMESDNYRMRYMTGHGYWTDPMFGYTVGDPWYSESAIEDVLEERARRG